MGDGNVDEARPCHLVIEEYGVGHQQRMQQKLCHDCRAAAFHFFRPQVQAQRQQCADREVVAPHDKLSFLKGGCMVGHEKQIDCQGQDEAHSHRKACRATAEGRAQRVGKLEYMHLFHDVWMYVSRS